MLQSAGAILAASIPEASWSGREMAARRRVRGDLPAFGGQRSCMRFGNVVRCARWAASSMAEHVAHNDLVAGSNPARPTTPLYSPQRIELSNDACRRALLPCPARFMPARRGGLRLPPSVAQGERAWRVKTRRAGVVNTCPALRHCAPRALANNRVLAGIAGHIPFRRGLHVNHLCIVLRNVIAVRQSPNVGRVQSRGVR